MRLLPESHSLQALCDSNTYTTMITLCGPWQQLRRAMQLISDMRARNIPCGPVVRESVAHPHHVHLWALNPAYLNPRNHAFVMHPRHVYPPCCALNPACVPLLCTPTTFIRHAGH